MESKNLAGTASFILAVTVLLGMIGLLGIGISLANSRPDDFDHQWWSIMGLMAGMLGLTAEFIAALLGLLSLAQKGRSNTFALAGLAVSSFTMSVVLLLAIKAGVFS